MSIRYEIREVVTHCLQLTLKKWLVDRLGPNRLELLLDVRARRTQSPKQALASRISDGKAAKHRGEQLRSQRDDSVAGSRNVPAGSNVERCAGTEHNHEHRRREVTP